jgi:hypothetical protein
MRHSPAFDIVDETGGRRSNRVLGACISAHHRQNATRGDTTRPWVAEEANGKSASQTSKGLASNDNHGVSGELSSDFLTLREYSHVESDH